MTSGEADAGHRLCHRRDGGRRRGRATSTSRAPTTRSPAIPSPPLKQTENADLAQAFVDLVLSGEGQQVLADAGFGAP